MKMINTKQREKIHFQIFQEKYCQLQVHEHTDSPDFLVSLNNETIGIEFTEIYKDNKIEGKPLKEHEAIKDRIVEWACKKAIENNVPPLHVGVIFSGSVSKETESQVKNSLYQIVKERIPQYGEVATVDSMNGDIDDIFYSIAIANFKGAKNHIWYYTEASGVETNFSEQLQSIINSKNENISRYLIKCNKCWLVIVALGLSGSSFFKFSEEMDNCTYKSSFDKVFFIEAYRKYVKELKLV